MKFVIIKKEGMKNIPIFRSAAKYEKRLLHQDDLWKMIKDFGFVPTIIK